MLAEILPRIAAEEVKEKGDGKYYHRPSSSGVDRCMRQAVYHALGYERSPLPGRMAMVFDDSSWHETLTADWIRKSAFKLHSEQMRVKCMKIGKQEITGQIDGILTAIDGTEYLYEHKAINHFTFGRYENGDIPVDYVCQIVLYLVGLRREVEGISKALLLVKNKNTARYMEIVIAYNFDKDSVAAIPYTLDDRLQLWQASDKPWTCDGILALIRRRWEAIDEAVAEKKLPPRGHEYGAWQCDYCGWGDTCWKGYADEEFKAREQRIVIADKHHPLLFDTLMAGREAAAQKKISDKGKEVLSRYMATVGAREVQCGELVASATITQRTAYDVPDKIKELYSKKTTSETIKIKEIKPDGISK